MCACEHGHLNIAKRLLLEPECDPSIEDNVSLILFPALGSFWSTGIVLSLILIR